MPKPCCVKCKRFYRVKRNGIRVLEQMPQVHGALPGTQREDDWTPYKIWQADLWRCEGCGHELVVGYGQRPIAEHYDSPTFQFELRSCTVIVNDC